MCTGLRAGLSKWWTVFPVRSLRGRVLSVGLPSVTPDMTPTAAVVPAGKDSPPFPPLGFWPVLSFVVRRRAVIGRQWGAERV